MVKTVGCLTRRIVGMIAVNTVSAACGLTVTSKTRTGAACSLTVTSKTRTGAALALMT